MLVLCTVIWGGTFPAVKLALESVSPWTLVALRFALAAILFLPVVYFSGQRPTAQMVIRGGLLGVLFVVSFGMQTLGLVYTSPSRSAFLTEALVLFVPVFSFLLSRKIPSKFTVTGALVVVAGLYLLTSPGGLLHWNRGDWLTLGCAITFSIYIIAVDFWSESTSRIVLSAVQCITVAMIALPLALHEGVRVLPSANLIAMLGYLVIPGTLIVVMLQMRYQPLTTPARAGVIFALEPVFAMIYAIVFSFEDFSQRAAAGAAVVTLGVLWSEAGRSLLSAIKTKS